MAREVLSGGSRDAFLRSRIAEIKNARKESLKSGDFNDKMAAFIVGHVILASWYGALFMSNLGHRKSNKK